MGDSLWLWFCLPVAADTNIKRSRDQSDAFGVAFQSVHFGLFMYGPNWSCTSTVSQFRTSIALLQLDTTCQKYYSGVKEDTPNLLKSFSKSQDPEVAKPEEAWTSVYQYSELREVTFLECNS